MASTQPRAKQAHRLSTGGRDILSRMLLMERQNKVSDIVLIIYFVAYIFLSLNHNTEISRCAFVQHYNTDRTMMTEPTSFLYKSIVSP